MILLIGFPKCGTMSFQKMFEKCKYKSLHWKKGNDHIGDIIRKNKKMKQKLLKGFENVDCITQMDVCIDRKLAYWPQITDFKQLYYENKDSIFILNKRDPKKLFNSFKKWEKNSESMYDRIYKFNPELVSNKSEEGFIEFVENHNKKVIDFFSNEPDANFIVYDIENDEITKLKKHINLVISSFFTNKIPSLMKKDEILTLQKYILLNNVSRFPRENISNL